jgi:signal transduction histidine kinase
MSTGLQCNCVHPSSVPWACRLQCARSACGFRSAAASKWRLSSTRGRRSLSSEIEIVLYRVVQEALQNVVKHSGATSVRIVLALADGSVEATVLDDGKGIDSPPIGGDREKFGLIGMRERLALVQGSLEVQTRPEAGTWLAARVPLPRTADDGD